MKTAPNHRRIFYGWYIAAVTFFTLMLTVGIPAYGTPFFYDYFLQEFGWSRSAATGGIAFATLLVQPLCGLLVHRFSPRKLIVFGSLMLCVSLVGFGLGTGNLILYYATWCAFMTGYIFAGPIPNQVILAQWFHRRRGLVMGIAYLGLGLGGALSQKFVALPLIHAFGWRAALIVMGALVLAVIPFHIFVTRDYPSEKSLFADHSSTGPIDSMQVPLPYVHLLHDRDFWLLAFGSFCSVGAIGSINHHMKLLFQDAHLSAATVADTTFYILMSSLAGRVVMGWLADVTSIKYVMIAAYLCVALPIPLLFIVDRPGMPALFAMVFGFGLGADFMLIPLMTARMFGAGTLARAMGVILPTDSIGQTCFPFLLGVLYDVVGNYQIGLAVISGFALLGAVAISFLPTTPKRFVSPVEALAISGVSSANHDGRPHA